MNLIAIETATENCSVALLHQNHIFHKELIAPQKHAELVLGYIQELLDEQGLNKTEIDGIVFGQGPGAFTGVRIATSIVQGLALALDLKVLPISTMHNMAHQIWQQNPNKNQLMLIANDARMGEVYWATFESKNGQLSRLSVDSLSAPEDVNFTDFNVCAGSAFQTMITVNTTAKVLPQTLPNAKTLIQIAQRDFVEHAHPINNITPSYVRENVVFN